MSEEEANNDNAPIHVHSDGQEMDTTNINSNIHMDMNTSHNGHIESNRNDGNDKDVDDLPGYVLQCHSSIRLPSQQEHSHDIHTTVKTTQQTLAGIYDSFSHQFPNPRVLEMRQRQAELQAAAIARSRPRVRAGLFARLFASDDDNVADANVHHNSNDTITDQLLNENASGDADVNGKSMENQMNGNNNNTDADPDNKENTNAAPLLGTDIFDWNVIPPEAHHCARLYLSSIQSKAKANSNAKACFQICKFDAQPSHEQKTMWVVVGVGQLVEMPLGTSTSTGSMNTSSASTDEISEVVQTNDRERLLSAYAQCEQYPMPLVPSMELTRCVQLSTNCIAISWGLDDGLIVVYRRVQLGNNGKLEWHQMALITALPQVVDAAGRSRTKISSRGGERGGSVSEIYQSGLLRVSDMMPLHLGTPQTGHKTILAIGRLGGYLEFIVLPNELCQGPILAPKSLKAGKGARQGDHYAVGLPNISDDGRLKHTWVPTVDYHTDIMAMSVSRTRVEDDCIWDESKFPDSPPAEYIICITGFSNSVMRSKDDGSDPDGHDNKDHVRHVDAPVDCECISLWGFTLLQDSVEDNDFSMRISPLQTLELSELGPAVTTFVSRATATNWDEIRPAPTQISPSVTTISPVTSLQIVQTTPNKCFISAMDYNGGVTVIDCGDVVRNATHEVGFVKTGMTITSHSDEMRLSNRNLVGDSGNVVVEVGWWLSPSGLHLVNVLAGGDVVLRKLQAVRGSTKCLLSIVGKVQVPPSTIAFVSRAQFVQEDINLLRYSTIGVTLCSIGVLHPRHFMSSLIRQERFQEALDMATKYRLNFDDASVMDKCYIHLWETNLDIDAFKKITDRDYVINQACSVGKLVETNPKIVVDIVSEVLQKGYSGKGIIDNGTIPTDHEAHSRIQFCLSRLGTFTMVNRLLGIEDVSPKRFVRRYLRADIFELAKSFAMHGDIRCVILVLVRHWDELSSSSRIKDIINCLPLSIPISEYEAILPSAGPRDTAKHWNDIIQAIEENQFLELFRNQDDKALIHHILMQSSGMEEGEFDVLTWYMVRAKEMIECFGFLDTAVLLLNKALERFEETSNDADSEIMLKILSLRASAFHIHCLVELGIHLDETLVERIQGMTIDEFESIGVKGAISLVLGGCRDSDETIFRYKELLCPMFCDDGTGTGTDYIIRCWPDLITGEASFNIDRRKELEVGTVLFCLENLQNSVDEDAAHGTMNHECTLIALSLCEAVAKASSTEIPTQKRLVDDVLFHMQFVLDVAKIVGSTPIASQVVTQLWQLYEFLPVSHLNEEFDESEGGLFLSQSLDSLYRSLVGIDLSLKWSTRDSHSVPLEELQTCHDMYAASYRDVSRDTSLIEISKRTLTLMCTGFCEELLTHTGPDLDTLFLEFLSDISDLNEQCFYSLAPVGAVFEECLIRPLLQHRSFLVLRKFLMAGIVNESAVETAIIAFATDVASNYKLDTKCEDIQILSNCMDFFSILLPQCRAGLVCASQFITATNFMTEILQCDNETISTFHAFKAASRESIIIDVMEKNPRTIILDCTQWENPSFSRDMLAKISQQFKTTVDSNEKHQEPPLGDPILHLANLLGLGDPRSQFFVKNFIAVSAINSGYHGVSAALCTIMLHSAIAGAANGQQIDSEAEEALLTTIALVASCKEGISENTKIELCRDCIRWQNNSDQNTAAFQSILQTHSSLESSILKERAVLDSSLRTVTEAIDARTENGKILLDMLSIIKSFGERDALKDIKKVDMDDVTTYVANQIVPWCAQSLISTAPSCQKKDVILKVLRLAIAVLLGDDKKVSVRNSIVNCESTLENWLTTNEGAPESPLTVDADIVAQMIHRGYTSYGAQRAAIMTNNESIGAAMVWAVGHATDNNFNDPMVILRSGDEGCEEGTAEKKRAISTAKILLSNAKILLGKKKREMDIIPTPVMPPTESRSARNIANGPVPSNNHAVTSRGARMASNGHSIPSVGCSLENEITPKPSQIQQNPRMIVVPTHRSSNGSKSHPGKKSLVEGGRQLLQNQRRNLRRSNRPKLAAEGRRLLEQAKGRPTTIDSCSSRGSIASGISSFTWNTFSEGPDKEKGKVTNTSCDHGDEESLNETHSQITRVTSSSIHPVGIPLGADTAEAEAAIIQKKEEECLAADTETTRIKKEEDERLAAEAESIRIKKDEDERLAAQAEAVRIKKEGEEILAAKAAVLRIQEEHLAAKAEAARIKKEEEELLAAQVEASRIKKVEEERLRVAAEAEVLIFQKLEEKRLAAEAEAARIKKLEVERLAAEAEALRIQKLEEERLAAAEAKAVRIRKEEVERLAAAAEALRIQKLEEEEKESLAAEAEALRIKKEEEEHFAAEAEALRIQKLDEEEERLLHVAAAEAEDLRIQKEEEERLSAEAEALKIQKLEEDEERLAAAEAENLRIQKEKEERLAAEAEALRIQKLEEEEERLLHVAAAEAEDLRIQKEEEERLAAEAEALRIQKLEEEEERLLHVAAAEAEDLRIQKEEEERLAAEAEALRIQKLEEEEARLAAAEAEALRIQKEEGERLAAEAEALRTQKLEEEEARLAAAEAEALRIHKLEEERLAAEAEDLRIQKEEEEEARLAAAEAEALRIHKLDEEEERRLHVAAAEAEDLRIQKEEKEHFAAEAEALKIQKLEEEEEHLAAAEAEDLRIQKEEEERLAADAEAARIRNENEERLAAEAEDLRIQNEENERLAAEAEALRIQKLEEEEARLAAAEAEAARIRKENEDNLAVEAEDLRIQKEEEERLSAEAEVARIRKEEEEVLAVEVEAARIQMLEEELLADEIEALRTQKEEEERLAAVAESARIKKEEEERLAAEAEAARRKKLEEERLASEVEFARIKEEEDEHITPEAESDNDSISLDDLCADDGWGFAETDSTEMLDTSISNLDFPIQKSLTPEGKLLRSGRLVQTPCTKKNETKDIPTGGSGSTSWSFEDVAIDGLEPHSTSKPPDDSLSVESIEDEGWDFDC
jgi:hypothetical protein